MKEISYSFLAEPIVRPDGELVEVLRQSNVPDHVIFNHCGHFTIFGDSIVERIGDGDFQMGLVRIGQEFYNAPRDQIAFEGNFESE